MGFITEEGLANLKKYKYVSGGRTLLDNLMNPWWEFVTTLMPMVSRPNLDSSLILLGCYELSKWHGIFYFPEGSCE
jgi:hypothetical protein